MKNYNVLSIILLAVTMVGCQGTKNNDEDLFSFNESNFKSVYYNNDLLSLQLNNPENIKIDSIIYYVNDKKIASKKGLEKVDFNLKDAKLGYQNLKALVYFEGDSAGKEITSRVEMVSNVEPKLLKYSIVNTFTHDTLSFTEGLEFHNGNLFESTGQKGTSYFRKYDYKTGKVAVQIDLDAKYFGEGITFINHKMYQLTWQEATGFIYDETTLKLEKTFAYDKKIEGWGMTNDGTHIYQSDGTEKIWKMNPDTQKMIDYINVYAGSEKIKSVNELEWINGKIYCNIWQKDAIAVVNPTTGAVDGILNMADLRKSLKAKNAEVLNGIAYNSITKTIFVTGKNWDKMFEIKVVE